MQTTLSAAGAPLTQEVSFSAPAGLFAGTLTLSLSGAADNQVIRYTLTSPSSSGAAAPAPSAASPAYSSPLALDSSTIVRAAVFTADGLAQGPVATAQFVRYADTGASGLAGFKSQLPLLVLDSHGFGPMVKDGVDRPGWIYGFAPGAEGSASLAGTPTFAVPLEFAVRGTSSARFPKQSFKLKLLGSNGKKQAIAPFGLGRFDKWQLIGPWGFDHTFIRNAFIYELSNRIGLWAPRTRFVEVFVNRDGDGLTALDHAGVYALTDKIEPASGRVEIADLDEEDITEPKVSGGYIFKVDWPDEDDYRWTTTGGVTLILDTPGIDDVTPEQAYYLEGYVQKFEDALFRDIATGWSDRAYLNYINRATWIDFHLLNTFTKNGDAFSGSTFFTKDRNGKLSAGPLWDFDRSMGSTDYRNDKWDQWRSVEDGGDGWYSHWWGKLVLDPDFMQGWIDRWQTLRTAEFSDPNLAGLADQLAAQIGMAAAARDVATFPDNASDYPGGYQGEIDHLKDWLNQRAHWIDRQFTAPPTITRQGGQVTITPPANATLVYTLDGTDPRGSNGTIPSGAKQSSGALVLPDYSAFSVRAHASGSVVFPATPWSSRITVAGTTPPPPQVPDLPRVPDTTAAAGHDFILSAGNTPGSIQWQVSQDQGTTWTSLSDSTRYRGTTTATLSLLSPDDTVNGLRYRFTTTVLGTTYTSNSATVTIVPAFLPFPTGIAIDAAGNIFVADAKSDSVGIINPAQQIRVLAGGGTPAVLNRPEGLVILSDGSVVVADTANDAIRRIAGNGATTLLAGRPGIRGHADGAASTAAFSSPKDVARGTSGALYVADAMNHVIRRISLDGNVTTFAGTAGASGNSDGNGSAARFNFPSALAIAPDGSVVVSDTTNHTVRRISAAGEVMTLAGLAGVSGSTDGTGNQALFNRPGGLVVDSNGNLYVADTGNSTIRKIAPDGAVTTFAGLPGIAGVTNGNGADALFNQPQDLALDAAGNLFVADTGNALLRKITPAREVSTVMLSAAPPSGSVGGGGSDPTTPPVPPSPNDDNENSSGGGGAPSLWFMLGLSLVVLRRIHQQRQHASNVH